MFSFYFLGFKKILGFLKKVFIVFAVYFIVVSLFLYFLNKDKPKTTFNPVEKNRKEIYKVINDPKLKNTKEGQITIVLYRTMLCGLIGEACTDNPKDGDKNFNHSVFGFITNLIVLPYANPPASGIYWAYSGLQNAGFVPKTYAAEGIGFAAIKPFMSIWKVFRDISYMLLVLVLIAIGFMIMFRTKINPQTVISVENSLPKIVVALLLITFSFPIAGFLIDLMYVVIALAISILAQANSSLNVGQLQKDYLAASPGTLLNKLFFLDDKWIKNSPELKLFTEVFKPFGLATGLINFLVKTFNIGNNLLVIFPDAIRGLLDLVALVFSGWTAVKSANVVENFAKFLNSWGGQLATIGAQIGNISKLVWIIAVFFALFFIIPLALPLLIGLLVALTLVFLFFRIFFILLTSYIKIFLYILLSPLILILEAIPGKSAFSSWFKNLLGELATFPLVVIVILLGNLIITTANVFPWPAVGVNQVWTPPFLYNINQQAWQFLIGYGIVLILPDLIKLFKESIGAKGMGVEIGLGTFFGGFGAAWGGGMGALQQFSSLLQVPGIGNFITTKLGPAGKWIKQNLMPPTFYEVQQQTLLAQEILQKGEAKNAIEAWNRAAEQISQTKSTK
jgi:preprotein translocase subunit SecG